MNEPRDDYTECSKSDRDRRHMISHVWNLIKMTQMNLSTKQKQTHRFQNLSFGYHR